jgi:hypothetical protein
MRRLRSLGPLPGVFFEDAHHGDVAPHVEAEKKNGGPVKVRRKWHHRE